MAKITVECAPFGKPTTPSDTGIGYFNHMLDQFTSHAQIGVSVVVEQSDGSDASTLLSNVGKAVGQEFQTLLSSTSATSSTFLCPLDEALVECSLGKNSSNGTLEEYTLAPFGIFPATGRQHIGELPTASIEYFFRGLAETSGLQIRLIKHTGRNAHHICESAFKATARALRNLIDGIDCNDRPTVSFLSKSPRSGQVQRNTRETSIDIQQTLDDPSPTGVAVTTGIRMLDAFWKTLAKAAGIESLQLKCQGDTWIDDHHTAEDVAIAMGQVWDQCLGSKAGCIRMWCVTVQGIRVTMDLSNRPHLTHTLSLQRDVEMIDDWSVEMFEHVLESLVTNARWTVHIQEIVKPESLSDMVTFVAEALGLALRYASAIDQRRAGQTASSKGTLSV